MSLTNFTNVSFKKVSKRKLIIIAVAILLLLASVFCIFKFGGFIKSTNSNSTNTVVKSQDAVRTDTLSDTKDAANASLRKKDVKGALTIYDNAIKNTSDNYLKSNLCFEKTSIALYDKQFDVAFESAKQGLSFNKSGPSLSNLGRVYEAKGDKQNAIKYYKQAADYVDSISKDEHTTSSTSYRMAASRLENN